MWLGPGASDRSLPERIEAVERWYSAHGASASYQLSPAGDPPELDAALAARGYAIHAPVSVEVADAAEVAAVIAGSSGGSPAEPASRWSARAGSRSRSASA